MTGRFIGLAFATAVAVSSARAQDGALDTATIYTSDRVRAAVTSAAERNRLPVALRSYRATAETEIATLLVLPDGREAVFATEQMASRITWRAGTRLEQEIAGYRNLAAGPQVATLSYLRRPFVIPVLYGNRMEIVVGGSAGADTGIRRVTAVHPLAADRDRIYRFTGGDTTVVMRVGDREIPITRVWAEPRLPLPAGTAAFRGELLIDAARGALVRLRGTIVTPAPTPKGLLERASLAAGLTGVAFVDAENSERDGTWWLPATQRLELHAAFPRTTDSRAVIRIVTRFGDFALNDAPPAAETTSPAAPTPTGLVIAPADSLGAFSAWRTPLGELSASVDARAFDDVAPDAWRASGAPSTRLRVARFGDAVHVNRIEGLYTGWGVEERLRDAYPGLTLRATAGWAWSEQTVRGRAEARLERGTTTTGLTIGRQLESTNDFRASFDSTSGIAAAFGFDEQDYVDRSSAIALVSRRTAEGGGLASFEAGVVRDAAATRHLTQGFLRGDSAFRDNRTATPGTYGLARLRLTWNPSVNAAFMRSGAGASLVVEQGSGDLTYTRAEVGLNARQNAGPWSVASSIDAAAVAGAVIPPQQLLEVGRESMFDAFSYKQFAGDRAAVARSLLLYRLPIWSVPIRFGRLVLPPLAPALAAGAGVAWTELSTDAARRAAVLLVTPAPLATDGARGSVSLGVRFFGGAIGFGWSRPVGAPAPGHADGWRLRVLGGFGG